MSTFAKAGFLLVSAFMLMAETPRKTSSDFFMESYSSGYRAAEYRAQYEKCGPHHDCINVTAGETRERFPFMGIPMGQ